ncbi:RluA family pseudouridine synthase [Aureispira anguillae]|uniref:RluA family pseudouridine synthase n=1 Tax=Aureispira anguillae TaxID=2864201 RepID=A0A915YG30_9BACT|nr:RluA family pseudouridine synthase [Aureispira anguillae]BDS12494.1 RluA family pseudouridine synthase [Aureispira anguillae]
MHLVLDTHVVPLLTPKQRLSDYLCGIFLQLPSRKSVKVAIKRGAIYVDGKKGHTGDWVCPEQVVELIDLDDAPTKVLKLPMDVIYEDDAIAVVFKPAGIPVSGNQFRTIENALLHNITLSTKVDALKKPRAVHRLDAPTSGLLLIAKTKQARMHLGAQFEAKTIQKKYQAIVIGQPPAQGRFDTAINHKAALSHFECLQTVDSLKSGQLSLLNLYPKTGRTHQLRIHLSQAGFPILGDKLYGIQGLILKHKGLFLIAVALDFEHPITGERQAIKLPTPYKYTALLNREQRRYDAYDFE